MAEQSEERRSAARDPEKEELENLEDKIQEAKKEAADALNPNDGEGFWDDKPPKQGPAGDAEVAPPG